MFVETKTIIATYTQVFYVMSEKHDLSQVLKTVRDYMESQNRTNF